MIRCRGTGDPQSDFGAAEPERVEAEGFDRAGDAGREVVPGGESAGAPGDEFGGEGVDAGAFEMDFRPWPPI